jgi:nicotinamidase-related amidase
MNLNDIFALAQKEEFAAAKDDAPRVLLLVIDKQNDFMEGGALGVPGSIGDVERTTRFIYNNMAGITKIMCSLDTHIAQQIFHPCWWVNAAGDHPAPYTIISYDDVLKNRWRPLIDPVKSLNYLKGLEQKAKKQLCIWPYHCIQGTAGAALENEFAKMVYFHSVARKAVNPMVQKGTDPYSEMYGIIEPEFSESNFLNTLVLNAIEKFDAIYVAGEAASHCLMESVRQIATHFANRPEITGKITILEDCTSPIPGYEADTKAAFDMFKNTYGIKFAKSTDIQLV